MEDNIHNQIIKFGKYKGKTFKWVNTKQPQYVQWILDNHLEGDIHFQFLTFYKYCRLNTQPQIVESIHIPDKLKIAMNKRMEYEIANNTWNYGIVPNRK